jgi:2-polyprenyl-3-methyl-5-hydroxy-6-metoxy-1,4-benzoquinol methylase
MPSSYQYFKQEVKQHLVEKLTNDVKILDVGPGCGTYGNLLKSNFNHIDAVEVWEKYIDQFKLRDIYQNVFVSNIIDFDFSRYDYLIIGDVLEHLSVYDAQKLINNINLLSKKCLIAVPYQYPQGSYEGNNFEAHLQPDLTHEIFLERYPSMNLLYKNELYGYYINY